MSAENTELIENPFEMLPNELLVELSTHLDRLGFFASTCKRFSNIIEDFYNTKRFYLALEKLVDANQLRQQGSFHEADEILNKIKKIIAIPRFDPNLPLSADSINTNPFLIKFNQVPPLHAICILFRKGALEFKEAVTLSKVLIARGANIYNYIAAENNSYHECHCLDILLCPEPKVLQTDEMLTLFLEKTDASVNLQHINNLDHYGKSVLMHVIANLCTKNKNDQFSADYKVHRMLINIIITLLKHGADIDMKYKESAFFATSGLTMCEIMPNFFDLNCNPDNDSGPDWLKKQHERHEFSRYERYVP